MMKAEKDRAAALDEHRGLPPDKGEEAPLVLLQELPGLKRPWSVDRWGRLLSGSSVLFFTALGLLLSPWWLIGTLAAAANLVLTSITDACALHDLLLKLGAREREELFLPGGVVRPEVLDARLRRANAELKTKTLSGQPSKATALEELTEAQAKISSPRRVMREPLAATEPGRRVGRPRLTRRTKSRL